MSLDNAGPSAIFFDWDGTLVDSYAVLESAHNHTRRTLGFEALGEGEFARYFGQPRDLLYNTLYPGKFDEARTIFEQYYRSHHLEGIRVLPGVEDLLKHLAEVNMPCGVVTNKKADFIREEIRHLGWEAYFKAVVGAGDAVADKPSPAPLQLAIEKSGVKSNVQSILMVGDTENDILCASRTGCKAVLIVPLMEQNAVLKHCSSDFTFKNCEDFKEFLLQYLKKKIKGNDI
ncbi:MAG: HAD-IA family hydrolase [Alphaproteobacteria bacterium]|nr:HAD-IA family hydrolase [Alphaproteobacteria bacterium]MCD8526235.1 HAD-IA family hydrolase [Alphaproteobacteria bacterium]MCD8570748.1 HAD-IA family hydrolase [Alphaproteobacteria bacterium]